MRDVMFISRGSLRFLMVAQDTLLFQKKRKAWQSFGGESKIHINGQDIKLKSHLCVSSAAPSHVMNELLETERAYVEELLCVLEVSAAIPSEAPTLFVVFITYCAILPHRGTLQRWTTLPWPISSPAPSTAKRTFCLATCLKSTSFIRGTHMCFHQFKASNRILIPLWFLFPGLSLKNWRRILTVQSWWAAAF